MIVESPPAYCPTCAVAIGAARDPDLSEKIRSALRWAENTGKKKFDLGVENWYDVRDWGVKVALVKGDEILARNVRGYGTAKAEIVAGLAPGASAELFRAYCDLCSFKHCLDGEVDWGDRERRPTPPQRDRDGDRDHRRGRHSGPHPRPRRGGDRGARHLVFPKRPAQHAPVGRRPEDPEALGDEKVRGGVREAGNP